MKPMEFTDEIYTLIYGNEANIIELKKQKKRSDVWDDIAIFLAKDDITKIKEIKNLTIVEVLDFLKSKINTIKANNTLLETPKIKPIGYKINDIE